MGRIPNKKSQIRGLELRLQLKEAITSLGRRELQAQSVWSVEHLVQSAEPQQLTGIFNDLFANLNDCTNLVRRLRFKLCAYALKIHAAKHWGQALFHVRDKVIERIGFEENAESAIELQCVMQQLAGAFIEAYCRGHFSSLGVASKEELPKYWLSQLLIKPTLLAANRGLPKVKLSNACLLVDGVLHQFVKWKKSSAVLYSATDCLKEMLRLTGNIAISTCEIFLPIQSCITLLGSRLTAAAIDGIIKVIVAGMSNKGDWQVRKGATDALAKLVGTLRKEQLSKVEHDSNTAGSIHSKDGAGPGLKALAEAQQELLTVVDQHVKYDRIPHVRAAAVLLMQEFNNLRRVFGNSFINSLEVQDACDPESQQNKSALKTKFHTRAAYISIDDRIAPGPVLSSSPRAVSNSEPAKMALQNSIAEEHASLIIEKKAAPQRTREDLDGFPCNLSSRQQSHADGVRSTEDSRSQSSSFSIIHPLFQLQMASNPVMVVIKAPPSKSQALSALLDAVKMKLSSVDNQAGAQLEVEICLQNEGNTGVANTYCYSLQGGQLVQQVKFGEPAVMHESNHTEEAQAQDMQPQDSNFIGKPGKILEECDAMQAGTSRPVRELSFKAVARGSRGTSPSSSPAGKSSIDMNMDEAAKNRAETIRPFSSAALQLSKLYGSVSCQPSDSLQGFINSSTASPPESLQNASQNCSLRDSPASSEAVKQSEWLQSTPLDGIPKQHVAMPPAPVQFASATITDPHCKMFGSPPCTPKTHQSGAVHEGTTPCQPKGPLTAIVTKALSRLQELEELQHWQESVSQQLGGDRDPPHQPDETDVSSEIQHVHSTRDGLDVIVQHSPGDLPESAEHAGITNSAVQARLSSISEGSQRYSGATKLSSGDSSGAQERLHNVGLSWQLNPTLSSIPEEVEVDTTRCREGDSRHGAVQNTLGLLWQLGQKLQCSKQNGGKRCVGNTTTMDCLGDDKNNIPAVRASCFADGSQGRPESRESGLSSPRYGCSPFQGDALQIDNPLFGLSRPGTAAEKIKGQQIVAADGEGPSCEGSKKLEQRESPASLENISSGLHDSFQAPRRLPSSDRTLSIGAVRSIGSMGSEFAIAGHDTEEEVRSFLRGSIVSPMQYALVQRRPCSQLDCQRTANNSSHPVLAYETDDLSVVPRPPRPSSASATSNKHGRSRPPSSASFKSTIDPLHVELPGCAHTAHGPMHAALCTAELRPEADAVARQRRDLQAILGSCATSPCSSVCTNDDETLRVQRNHTGPAVLLTDDILHGRICNQAGQQKATPQPQMIEEYHPSCSPAINMADCCISNPSQKPNECFNRDACGRLNNLQGRLSPMFSTSPSLSEAAHPRQGAHTQAKFTHDDEHSIICHVNMSPRPPSPAAPGLPISQKQALTLCRVVEKRQKLSQQQATNLQGVLMDMLELHKRDVKACIRQQQQQELDQYKQQHGEHLSMLDAALQKEGDLFRIALEQAARREMDRYASETLPIIADIVSSEDLLGKCFQLVG